MLLSFDLRAQVQLREATAAEAAAGTAGSPIYMSPRRTAGASSNTNALTVAQQATLALAVTNLVAGTPDFVIGRSGGVVTINADHSIAINNTGLNNMSNPGNTISGTFIGDGSSLTSLNLSGNGSGLTNTTITYNPSTTNYTYTFLGRAGDHVVITNKPNLFLTLAGAVDGDVAFAIEATNNIYIDYGGNSVEWLTPSNNPTASQGHGTLGISKFGSLVKVAFVEGAASITNFLSAIQTYSTNVTLVSATSLVVQLNPGFSDANYVVTAPNDLVGATVTSRTPTNFTLGFTAATLTSQVIEGGVIHR